MKTDVSPPTDGAAEELLCGIAPLERLRAPTEAMDGRFGTKRMSGPCGIPADTDVAAILYWIDDISITDSAMKQRRQMAEKLLNWAYFERGKAFSSFEREDFAYFLEFIAQPLPTSKWVMRKGARRSSPAWRPFAGPLTDTSQLVYRGHLASLLNYFREHRYANLQCVEDKASAKQGLADSTFAWQRPVGMRTTEVLSSREWFWVSDWLRGSYGASGVGRERLVLEVLYFAAMTVTELAALTKDHLWTPEQTGGSFWIAYRERDGQGIRRADEVPEELDTTLARWFQSRPGQAAAFERGAPLVGLGIDELNEVVRQAFHSAARRAEAAGDVQLAEKLRQRTPRCLRHGLECHKREWPLEVLKALRPRHSLTGKSALRHAPGSIKRAVRAAQSR